MKPDSTEYVAPGVELHHKHTPEAEKGLPFALCYLEHRKPEGSVWYVLRRAKSIASANRMMGHIIKTSGNKRRSQFYVWESGEPWEAPE